MADEIKKIKQVEVGGITYDVAVKSIDHIDGLDSKVATENGIDLSLVTTGEKYEWNSKVPVFMCYEDGDGSETDIIKQFLDRKSVV